MCASHCNLMFAFEDAVANCKRCDLPLPSVDHYVDLIEMMCDTEDGEPERKCLIGECETCSDCKLLNESFFFAITDAPPDLKF